jgi:hypothetical protein
MLGSLGVILCPSANTPVRVYPEPKLVSAVYFNVWPFAISSGQYYVGVTGLDTVTGANVLRVMRPATPNATITIDTWMLQGTTSMAPIDLAELWIACNVDNTGGGLLVGYLI